MIAITSQSAGNYYKSPFVAIEFNKLVNNWSEMLVSSAVEATAAAGERII